MAECIGEPFYLLIDFRRVTAFEVPAVAAHLIDTIAEVTRGIGAHKVVAECMVAKDCVVNEPVLSKNVHTGRQLEDFCSVVGIEQAKTRSEARKAGIETRETYLIHDERKPVFAVTFSCRNWLRRTDCEDVQVTVHIKNRGRATRSPFWRNCGVRSRLLG